MLILYTIISLIIYAGVVFIIGNINFKENVKKNTLLTLAGIYNGFIGYIDTYVFLLLYGYFTNRPNGGGYEVPETELDFNVMLGIITLIIYLILLIPINIYMKKKAKVNTKIYVIINIVATILGIVIFWIFLDKNQKLF